MQTRIHIVVNHLHQRIQRTAAAAAQPVDHLAFAAQPMLHQPLHRGRRVLNNITVARRNLPERIGQQQLQGFNIGFHVATGRNNHHRRAVHDVIASEQHALFLEKKTVVVTDMPGRMDCPQGNLVSGQNVIVLQFYGGLEGLVLMVILRRHRPDNLGTGSLRHRLRSRGMIGVRVGADNPVYAVADRVQNGINVRRNRRARIQHGNLFGPEQIGIGARASHHSRIGGDQSTHPAIKTKWHAVLKHRARPDYLSIQRDRRPARNPRHPRRSRTIAGTLDDNLHSPITPAAFQC